MPRHLLSRIEEMMAKGATDVSSFAPSGPSDQSAAKPGGASGSEQREQPQRPLRELPRHLLNRYPDGPPASSSSSSSHSISTATTMRDEHAKSSYHPITTVNYNAWDSHGTLEERCKSMTISESGGSSMSSLAATDISGADWDDIGSSVADRSDLKAPGADSGGTLPTPVQSKGKSKKRDRWPKAPKVRNSGFQTSLAFEAVSDVYTTGTSSHFRVLAQYEHRRGHR